MNTTDVSPVTVQYTDASDSGNNLEGQCYQNLYGVQPDDIAQYPSAVADGE